MTTVKKKLSYLKSLSACVTLSLFLLLNSASFGQTTNTNQGNEFWFGFPANHDVLQNGPGSVTYALNITSFYNTTGTVSIPGQGYTQAFTVTSGNVTRLVIPSNYVGFDQEGIFNYAVNVVAANPIEVFYDEESSGPRNDNSYVIPDTLLGTEYYVTTYNGYEGSNNDPAAQFIITTPGDTVRVRITPTVSTAGGHAAGVPYDTTIYPGQVYNVRSTGLQDLTGTRIIAFDSTNSAKKFSVSAGQDVGSAGCNGTVDPMFDEMIPVIYWGKSYIFVPIPGITDICRTVACQNNTIVQINGATVATLNAGQYYDQYMSTPSYVSANNPINCVRLLLTEGGTGGCNGSNTLGDPDMIIVQPNEQMYMDSITFYANTINGMTNNWVEVVTRTSDVNNVFLDGTNIGSDFAPLAQGPTPNQYSYATVPVSATGSPGTYHQLTTTGCGILAYMEGLGGVTSTGTAAGIYLRFPNGGVAKTASSGASCSLPNGTASVNVTGGVGPFSYSWSDPNRQTTQTATGLLPGTYTVIVYERCDVGNDTAKAIVPNNGGRITAGVSANPTSVCLGNSTTLTGTGGTNYMWSWSDGSASSPLPLIVTPTSFADTIYTVRVSNGVCDTVKDSIKIKINPAPIVTIRPIDTIICTNGGPATITATGGSSYSWTPNTGTTSSPGIFLVKPLSTTTYTTTITNTHGCAKDTSVVVNVNSPPKVRATVNASICKGKSVNLNVTSTTKQTGIIYVWADSAGLSCVHCHNPIASPVATTTYTLTSTLDGCDTVNVVTVTVNPYPVPYFYANPDTADIGQSVDFVNLTPGSNSYTWTLGDGTGSTDSIPTPHAYSAAGLYPVYLIVTNSFNCKDTLVRDVFVNEPIKVPNIFTPNGDMVNDEFVVEAKGMESYDIKIYDRWGKKVFESESATNSWDGKNASGTMESDGTYYYIIQAVDFAGTKHDLNGYLQLIR